MIPDGLSIQRILFNRPNVMSPPLMYQPYVKHTIQPNMVLKIIPFKVFLNNKDEFKSHVDVGTMR